MLDACVDAFEATGDDRVARRRPVRSRATCSSTTGTATYRRRTRRTSGQGFFARSDLVTDLHAQPKEIFDGATPSSHAVACRALARLALCTGDAATLVVAQRLVDLAASLLAYHPGAVPDLLEAAGFALAGVEVVIPGDANVLVDYVRTRFTRRAVLVTGTGPLRPAGAIAALVRPTSVAAVSVSCRSRP